ncbi:LysR family transcriptional regulator [Methylobacterium oryzisoli]|uniref:LysR family transcriptional regulator n=1 Tax=Methylobacterium oryzisoli TaxID=3385502 RepID=UPI003891DF6E
MPKPTVADLEAFSAIAAHRSFRRAADQLGVARSTLSHVITGLERDLGVRLLHRTTRSVTTTEAGERLLARVGPILRDLEGALDEVADDGGQPTGTLRINANDVAARMLLRSVVPTFLERYHSMALDLVTEGRLVDIVDQGFDAGIRLAEAVPRDMIAVPMGGDARFVAVASPVYLAARAIPIVPDDLHRHRCIRHRLPSGKLYRWEFERHGQEVSVDVPGVLTLDSPALMAEAALAGMGIAYVSERTVAAPLADGSLRPVLGEWCPRISGLCLYYSGRRHVPAGLRAFIDLVKQADFAA